MPYDRDEFFPDADERQCINDGAADRVALLVALELVASHIGLDISDTVAEAKRDLCGDEGVDLDDYDAVFEDAAANVGSCPVSAAGRLLAELKHAEAKRERESLRQFRKALPGLRAFMAGGAA